MTDEAAEAALVAFLARLTESDGPHAADSAIALYLGRIPGDEERRRAALQRLSRRLIEFEETDADAVPHAMRNTSRNGRS